MQGTHGSPATGVRAGLGCEVADIFRRYGPDYRRRHRLPLSHLKVMHAIEVCRTAALGGHRESCAQCGFQRYAYNSCRNRHCPKCQTLAKAKWLEDRKAELLPVPYFHTVFTLPHELNRLILAHQDNPRELLGLLFRSAADTLLEFGRNNLGGKLGVSIVLHTWDQQLRPHMHVHCVVTGGVLTDAGRWKASRGDYLFPVKALSRVFRGKFLAGLKRLFAAETLTYPDHIADLMSPVARQALIDRLYGKSWVVYSKRPFSGPQRVLDYLGRYTHRVAISNCRLLSAEDGRVRFRYRDRADDDTAKTTSVPAHEFIRRFLRHVLPPGFMRIRHYGLLASRNKQELLKRCRVQLGVQAPVRQDKSVRDWMLELTGLDIMLCPACGASPLERIELPTPSRPRLSIYNRPANNRAPPECPTG